MSFSEICNGKIYVVIQFSCQFMKSKDANAKKEQHFNGIFALRIDTFQDLRPIIEKEGLFLEGQSFISSLQCSSQGQNVINMVSLGAVHKRRRQLGGGSGKKLVKIVDGQY